MNYSLFNYNSFLPRILGFAKSSLEKCQVTATCLSNGFHADLNDVSINRASGVFCTHICTVGALLAGEGAHHYGGFQDTTISHSRVDRGSMHVV